MGKLQSKLFLKLPGYSEELWDQIKRILSKYPGETEVVLYLENNRKKMKTQSNYWVTLERGLLSEMKALLGGDAVKVV